MKTEQTQLKLNIKGKVKKFWNTLFLKNKMNSLGVEVQNIKDVSLNHVEIVVSGEKSNLWDVVKWSKSGEVFFILNEVVFEFAEVSSR